MLAAFVAPALAGPEVWLQHKSQGPWSKDSITFNLDCSLTYAVSPYGHTFDYDNPIDDIPVTDTSGPTPTWNAPGGYPASTHILVEARNVAGNAGDQEMLPADHPGRAWGARMWCQLWNGCTPIKPVELDIMLTQNTPSGNMVTLSDHNSSKSGTMITVTRRDTTILSKKVVSINRLCTSPGDTGDYPGQVTITGQKVAERILN